MSAGALGFRSVKKAIFDTMDALEKKSLMHANTYVHLRDALNACSTQMDNIRDLAGQMTEAREEMQEMYCQSSVTRSTLCFCCAWTLGCANLLLARIVGQI